jgi:hypothetical protein
VSGELAALVIGTLLAVGAIAFVLWPLFTDGRYGTDEPQALENFAAGDSAIAALREIEFDRATGKLSDRDYAELRAQYGERALQELRARGDVDATPADAIEAAVLRYRMTHRECRTCGLRPEPDAIYCSTCGAFLDTNCPVCSARIVEPAASYCSSCGADLVARSGRSPIAPEARVGAARS